MAEILSRHRRSLSLTGLTSLSEVAARHFVEGGKYCKGSVLVLGFQELPETLLTALTPPPPTDNPLDQITDRFSWAHRILRFPWITDLTDEVAREFRQHDCPLAFPGLTALSDEVAEILGQYTSGLSLQNLAELSDNAADGLSRRYAEGLKLNLDNLPDTAVQILRDNGYRDD